MQNTFPCTVTRTPLTKRVLLLCAAVTLFTVLFLAGCSTEADLARPVEEEQIKNVVKDYFVREGSVPDYAVTIEEVNGNWARVHVAPAGADNVNGTPVLYQVVSQFIRHPWAVNPGTAHS